MREACYAFGLNFVSEYEIVRHKYEGAPGFSPAMTKIMNDKRISLGL